MEVKEYLNCLEYIDLFEVCVKKHQELMDSLISVKPTPFAHDKVNKINNDSWEKENLDFLEHIDLFIKCFKKASTPKHI